VTTGVVAPPGPQAAGRRRPSPRPTRRHLRRLLVLGVVVALAGAAVLVAARRAGAVRAVPITIHHSRFQPAAMEVPVGATVRFEVTNTDPIDHELIVGDEPVHQRHRVGRDRHHHGDVPGEVSVAAGGTAATTFRFDHPGPVLFICHLPGHEAYGMVGVVNVRA
jgi:uncharacterized cupredoxin-like copper-binding protein